jgi:hypothetical protein
MTLLVAWAAVDTHGTSSIYVASDSRISWGTTATFDRGRKVFAFQSYPDVLGYCGDVLFPSLALSQIVEIGEAGLLFGSSFTGSQKFQAIVKKLNHLVVEYPSLHAGLAENSLSIVHASRDINQEFSCHRISWTSAKGWSGESAKLPSTSGILFALGSASKDFLENFERYRVGPTKGTSRAVFHCFCDTLANSGNKTIGGTPQLVGIIRKSGTPAISYGVIHAEKRTYLGAPVGTPYDSNTIQWRNENFELCDGKSGKKLPKARPQPDPFRKS